MKIQNTKTKIATMMTSLVIGLTLMSSTTILPNVDAALLNPNVPHVPALATSTQQGIINLTLAIPGLQNWSHSWQYATNGFLGNNKVGSTDFQWKYEIVVLKAPSNSAPVACDQDWWARVVVDTTTMKVVSATYPTMESHPCHGQEFTLGSSHSWSTATQGDVNNTLHVYYGNYAELKTPSFNTKIYQDLNRAFLGYLLNANFHPSSTSYCADIDCFEQAGWTITACNIAGCLPVNSTDIIFVDESTYNNLSGHLTSLEWINGYTSTLDAEIDCAYTSPDYGIVTDNGTNMDTETTKIPCSTHQNSTSTLVNENENSVFFENADKDANQKWSSDITSTVSATNAQEYNGSTTNLVYWHASHDADINCSFHPSVSKVISGSLASSGTASWSSLSKQPPAC